MTFKIVKLTGIWLFGEWNDIVERESRRTKHYLLGNLLVCLLLVCSMFLIGRSVSMYNERVDLTLANIKLNADMLNLLSFGKSVEDFYATVKQGVSHMEYMMRHENPSLALADTFSQFVRGAKMVKDKYHSELAEIVYNSYEQIISVFKSKAEDGTLDEGDREAMHLVLARLMPSEVYEEMPDEAKILTFNHQQKSLEVLDTIKEDQTELKKMAEKLHNNQLRIIELSGLDKPFHVITEALSIMTGLPEPVIICLMDLIFGLPGYVLMTILPVFPLEYFTRQFDMTVQNGEFVRVTSPLSVGQYILLLWFGKGIPHIPSLFVFALTYLYANKCWPAFSFFVDVFSRATKRLYEDPNTRHSYTYTFVNILYQITNNRQGPLALVMAFTIVNAFGYLVFSTLDTFGIQLYSFIQFLEIEEECVAQYVKLRLAMLYGQRFRILAIIVATLVLFLIYKGFNRCLNSAKIDSKLNKFSEKKSTKMVKKPEKEIIPAIKREKTPKKLLASELKMKVLGAILGGSSWIYPMMVTLSTMASSMPDMSTFLAPIGNTTFTNSGLYYWVLWVMEMVISLEKFVPPAMAEYFVQNWL